MGRRANLLIILALAAGLVYGRFVVPALIVAEPHDLDLEDTIQCRYLEFRVDPAKCQRWGVSTADVNNVVGSALSVYPQNLMVEGEKLFNIAIPIRDNETSILDIPVDIINNTVVVVNVAIPNAGSFADPNSVGTQFDTNSNASRLRIRDLVSLVAEDDAQGMKCALAEALLRLRCDQEILAAAARKSLSCSNVFLAQSQRNVAADHDSIARILKRLRALNVAEEDIQAVYGEAEQSFQGRLKPNPAKGNQ